MDLSQKTLYLLYYSRFPHTFVVLLLHTALFMESITISSGAPRTTHYHGGINMNHVWEDIFAVILEPCQDSIEDILSLMCKLDVVVVQIPDENCKDKSK